MSSREQLWQRAQQQVAETLAALQARSAVELRRLIASPEQSELSDEGPSIGITTWAREHPSGKLGVIVEAREVRLGGIVHSVSGDGFFVYPDGTMERMTEEDLWDHGY
jgi:hypothetical protein